MKKISVVIPVFRNEGSLKTTLEQLESNIPSSYLREYIFVDDGSDDGSLDILLNLQKEHSTLIVLELSRNFGQVPAILAGLKEATGNVTIIISADLQDPITLIPQMLKYWEKEHEIVIAHRIERRDPFFQKWSAAFFYYLLAFANIQMPKGGFDFVALDKKVVYELKKLPVHNRFLQGDILALGFKIQLIPYKRQGRLNGKSQWKFWKRLTYFFNAIIAMTRWPLLLIIGIGSFFTFLGSAFFMVDCLNKPTPWLNETLVLASIFGIGGLLFILLGILGEYIWRIYDASKGQSGYIIRKKHKKHT